ncbi:MAG: PAAR domain-containing protein [Achromobacter sp.]|uniref:PAAR domain-containing protein n=1 Tax=Achromobacter sp. TaxID=134375 RepID=UPI003D04387A
MPEIIRKDDSTDHGGSVLEGFPHTNLNGKPIAGVGHQVSCPKCDGVFPIVQGSATYKIIGTPVALHGMTTACGARLIASGSKARVERQAVRDHQRD